MDFKLGKLQADLGVTAFENMFLDMYVEKADGNALKFYLLVYKDIYNLGYVDKAKIMKKLKLSEEDFNESINYWIGMGAFRELKDIKGKTYLEVVSFRQMVYGDNTIKDSNQASLDIAGRKALMFENVESIIDRALTTADITRIHETLDEYGQDPELVTEAFRQAKQANNVDVKYVMGYMKSWRDKNIMTLNNLAEHKERAKLIRNNSPRKYTRNNKTIDQGSNDKSLAQKSREERIKRMLEGGHNES